MSVMQTVPFGTLLKQLRKRAGMTQRNLAAALGYSDSLISGLEKGQRQPDIDRGGRVVLTKCTTDSAKLYSGWTSPGDCDYLSSGRRNAIGARVSRQLGTSAAL